MENLFIFLFRSSVSIILFYLLYMLSLRKSTHFIINRIFLVSSLFISVLIAAFPVHYIVEAKTSGHIIIEQFSNSVIYTEVASSLPNSSDTFSWSNFVVLIYISGVIFTLLRILKQIVQIIRLIHKSESKRINFYYIHENHKNYMPFSFFNHIFLNQGSQKQEEIDDIITHELVHIRERHWIDLLLIELLTVIFWFNPFIWLYEKAIKQNHEYLADQGVLSMGQSAVRYQVLLVNQLMGMQIIKMTNNLNFALGPTRLKMMTKQKTSKLKLLHLLWSLPAIALLLTAFAEPEYEKASGTIQNETSPVIAATTSAQEAAVHATGKVLLVNGDPLQYAHVIVDGTTVGTITDESGSFEIDIPGDAINNPLYASFVGYQTAEGELQLAHDLSKAEYIFEMEREVIGIDTSEAYDETLLPEESNSSPEGTYGEEMFVLVEEMPAYPGGYNGLANYLKKSYKKLKSKNSFNGEQLQGKAAVKFTVDNTGKVTNITILDSTSDVAGEALASIAAGMDKWEPGKQAGVAVPVDYAMQLEF